MDLWIICSFLLCLFTVSCSAANQTIDNLIVNFTFSKNPVQIGDWVYLKCSARRKDPANDSNNFLIVTFEWIFIDSNGDKKVLQTDKGEFYTISSVDFRDSGMYMCSVSNEDGISYSKKKQLTVFTKPVLNPRVHTNLIIPGEVDEEVEFVLHVISHPTADVECRDRNGTISYPKYYEHNVWRYKVKVENNGTYGNYQCYFSNEKGNMVLGLNVVEPSYGSWGYGKVKGKSAILLGVGLFFLISIVVLSVVAVRYYKAKKRRRTEETELQEMDATPKKEARKPRGLVPRRMENLGADGKNGTNPKV